MKSPSESNPYRAPAAHLGRGETGFRESIAVRLLRWINRLYLVFVGFVLVFLFAVMNVPLDVRGALVLLNLALPAAAYVVASAGLKPLRLPLLALLVANLGWDVYRMVQDLQQTGQVDSVAWVLTGLLLLGLVNLRVFARNHKRKAGLG